MLLVEPKSRDEDLIKIIEYIKSDKAGILSCKNLNSYYEFMYKHLPSSKNIVDFIDKLITTPVREYVDNIEGNATLLNPNGTLNTVWDSWHIAMTSQGRLDDVRFNKFREKCFELSKINMPAADELYRVTRTFIIENSIIEEIEKLKYIFMATKISIPYSYKKIAEEYIRDCYDFVKKSDNVKVCNVCGYVNYIDGKEIIHRLCNPIYSEESLMRGTLILKPEIFYAITNPGRFEIDVYNALLLAGYDPILFPEIERNGDILVNVCGRALYLDMKAYNYFHDLYIELANEKGYLKEKYRNRWLVVPDLYYQEQLNVIGYLLKDGGSRLYNIKDLIKKLNRIAKEGNSKC